MDAMDRAEHLQWAKGRALGLLDSGDISGAVTSMLSDLGKHKDLRDHPGIDLGKMQMLTGLLTSPTQARDWITGFN